MWTCLPFLQSDEEERETTAAALHKKDEDASPAAEILAAQKDASAMSKMMQWHYTGVTLWFRYLVDYMEQSLLTYFHNAMYKMEKLEYYD